MCSKMHPSLADRLAESPVTLADSYRFARRLTRQSGSSFRYSFLLLPRSQYKAMCVLYAFMRITDDLADDPLPGPSALSSRQQSQTVASSGINGHNLRSELTESAHLPIPVEPPAAREDLLRQWRVQLQLALAGDQDGHPLHPALRTVVREYGLAPEWLEDVITGVEYDLQPRCLADFAELRRYCYLVAGTVGLCCQAIWRADIEATRDWAIACGEAFQLTNILRDLREDAELGRCYLPAEDLQQFDCSLDTFQSGLATPGFLALMNFQLERARTAYRAALPLDSALSGPGRRMFRVMFRTYATLLERIAASPADVLQGRIRLSKRERLAILLTAPPQRLTLPTPQQTYR